MQVIANARARINTAIETTGNVDAAASNQDGLKKYEERLTPAKIDVLVAEDNEVNQIVFQQILEETGVAFKIVENGRLAVSAYKANTPQMILMDVSMPEMNGKEATEAIRSYERDNNLPRVPIVGVTAHALKGDMEACLDAGMDDYLSKPVSPTKLEIKVQQWLKLDVEKNGSSG